MHRLTIPILFLVVVLSTGCEGKPFAYHDDNQIPQGPGLVSGEDGVFSVDISNLGNLLEDRHQHQ